jgi:hypothetical protein
MSGNPRSKPDRQRILVHVVEEFTRTWLLARALELANHLHPLRWRPILLLEVAILDAAAAVHPRVRHGPAHVIRHRPGSNHHI